MFKRFAVFAGITLLMMAGAEAKPVIGMASYYKSGYKTASGERFNPNGFTAAHRTLPFGTKLLVTNMKTGKTVIVRVNDRGPFSHGRVLDLSLGAAREVGLVASGVARISFEIMD